MAHPRASPVRVALALGGVACALVVAGSLVVYSKLVLGHDTVHGLVRKFDLDAELNVPTWFSAALLLVAAAVLAYIGARARRDGDAFTRHWQGLAWIFLLMSLDETAGLHGLLTRPVRAALHVGGALYYAWVVPVAIGLVVFLAIYSRFVWKLPRHTREWMIASGIVYVAGALGGELIEGAYQTAKGMDLTFAVITVVEEALEMAGAVMFIYTLLGYISARWGEVRVDVAELPQ